MDMLSQILYDKTVDCGKTFKVSNCFIALLLYGERDEINYPTVCSNYLSNNS